MRKIERKMIQAIRSEKNWKLDNTNVEVFYSGVHHTSSYDLRIEVRLYNHLIATIYPLSRSMRISSCGYTTNTTKSRLNSLLHEFSNCRISQNNWEWFIGSEEFVDGMFVPFRN